MTYKYAERADNVYLLDTGMFGFANYQSSYLIKGKELALIDTGIPPSLDIVRAAIKKHGFEIKDISYIFVTHCEHADHSGNVGPILQEATRARVYINPVGAEYLADPSVEFARMRQVVPANLVARFGTMMPVPSSRIEYLTDGQEIDLGDGEKLKVFFTPGHQPSGIVLHARKNNGLFINDLCGMYLADADFSLILCPDKADVRQSMKSLNKVKDIPVSRLFLGHFGICDMPKQVIENALSRMQRLLDIGDQCVNKGQPDEIAGEVLALVMKEAEKLKTVREGVLYPFMRDELGPNLSRGFARYYLGLKK
jgi:glyoxylase-like metal-dependent hydrolase (beta-lactamase superfamily II)